MTLTPVKTPLVAKKMFPNYVWDIKATNEKILYFTFDDGPTPEITNWTLNTLKEYNAKATFFCIGNNIEKHPDIFQNILNDGHTVGNHTNNHIKGWKTNTKDYLENINLCERVFKNQVTNTSIVNQNSSHVTPKSLIVNQNSSLVNQNASLVNPKSSLVNQNSLIVNLFRPPYGQITPIQGKKLTALGYKIIMWDILSFDWDKNTPEEICLKNVTSKATNGSIVVFHDSVKASKNMQYVLPRALEFFTKKGFSFQSLKH